MRNSDELVTTMDTYKLYKKRAKVIRFTRKEYSTLVGNFMKFLFQQLLDGEEIFLPFYLGRLYVMGYKVHARITKDGEVRDLAPSWMKTLKLWEKNPEAKKQRKIVYCTNEHSDGYRYHMVWSKTSSKLKHKRLYSFVLCRKNKRALHARIMAGQEYLRRETVGRRHWTSRGRGVKREEE